MAVGIVLLPIYTRYLSPRDYGLLEMFVVTSVLLVAFMELGLGTALIRSVLYRETTNKRELVSTSLYFLILFVSIVSAMLCIYSDWLSRIIFGTAKISGLLSLIVLTSALRVVQIVPLSKLRIEEESMKYTFLCVLNFLVLLSLNLYFVVVLKKGVEGLIYAGFINAAWFALILIGVIIKDLGLLFSIEELKEMLLFGVPLVPAVVGFSVLVVSDRYFLKYYCSLKELGLYSLGYKIGMGISLFVNAFQTAWPTVLFSVAKEENAQEIYAKVLTYFLFIFTFLALGLSVFAREIVLIMATTDYYLAYKVVSLITISYLFYGLFYITAVGVSLKRKTQFLPFIVGGAVAVNLGLNFLLIPRFGMIGAALATFFSYVVLTLISSMVSLKLYPINYEYKRLWKIVIVGLSIYLLSLLTVSSRLFLSLSIKTIILISYPFILFFLGFFEKRELDKIEGLLNKWAPWMMRGN